MSTSGYHHLSLKDREHIETMLNQGLKLIEIANSLNRDPRGIKLEIKKHRSLFVRQNAKNKCGLQYSCMKTRLCHLCASGKCKYCSVSKCSELCDDFQEFPDCKRCLRFPYVCNGCDRVKSCILPKLFYKARNAQDEYNSKVSDSKRGIKRSDAEMKDLDYILSQGIRNGHSIGVIIALNKLDIAPSTAYRYTAVHRFSFTNLDLKRKVRYHQYHTKKPVSKPLNYNYLEHRRFEDYCSFILEHTSANIWQMDTVEGVKGCDEPVILTLLYTKTNLQLYFRLKSSCSSEVNRIFDGIKKYLGTDVFKQTFECILTDNGKEFRDPLSIEVDPETGEKVTSVFFCEARRSEQKGKCEKNHEHFRELIPKGKSFRPYTNKHFNYISNQINNYPRKSLNYNSPYDISKKFLNEKVLELNRLHFINHNDVILKHLIIK